MGQGKACLGEGGAPTGQPISGREKQVMGVCKPLTRILKKEFKNPTLGKVGVNTEKLEFDLENLGVLSKIPLSCYDQTTMKE